MEPLCLLCVLSNLPNHIQNFLLIEIPGSKKKKSFFHEVHEILHDMIRALRVPL